MINDDTAEKLNKIKHNINHDFALTFKQADIEKYRFIPVSKKNDLFFRNKACFRRPDTLSEKRCFQLVEVGYKDLQTPAVRAFVRA